MFPKTLWSSAELQSRAWIGDLGWMGFENALIEVEDAIFARLCRTPVDLSLSEGRTISENSIDCYHIIGRQVSNPEPPRIPESQNPQ
jgi:hypothetical protein